MISNVEITSIDMVKPSSPTPKHLKNLKLSFLDQLAPPVYEPMIFFYEAEPQLQTAAPQQLKQSLSNVLTQFYPLAGRLSLATSSIVCSDSGALFIESKIDANLVDIITDPTMDDMEKLRPVITAENDGVLLAVQINLFNYGGLAVCVQIHHNFADAVSQVHFTNTWAAVSRGRVVSSPNFDLAANLFPPKDIPNFGYKPSAGETIVTKRLVLDRQTIEQIKQAEKDASQLINDPTRVEAISAFLIRHFKKPVAVTHVVNLRPRTDPPLPDHAFGNLIGFALVMSDDDAKQDVLGALRTAIKKVDADHVRELQRGDEYLKSMESFAMRFMNGEFEYWSFTSVCRLPVYEVDYGWGKPVWVSPGLIPYKNLVILMGTSSGDGIEVWINVLEEDSAIVQKLIERLDLLKA